MGQPTSSRVCSTRPVEQSAQLHTAGGRCCSVVANSFYTSLLLDSYRSSRTSIRLFAPQNEYARVHLASFVPILTAVQASSSHRIALHESGPLMRSR